MNASRSTIKNLRNFTHMRDIHLSTINCKKVIAKNGKNSSSTRWLTRQLSDPYVEKSKTMNLRCRSAFKLIEIDDKYRFLTAGQVVIDCGAAPGSWTQVAVKRVNAVALNPQEPRGIVISIDKQPIYPIEEMPILHNKRHMQS
ncbi:rRNA methyltransferase 2, mitochondrial isoform X2 [Agrilus planipennis]|uniref:rRNA methyltransferase 2, mitochondrial n=1 Tax=Agrilus planipennis TaxID=224129 RepID=A0A1W4XGN3_AGRPL|nr:rRNA methyltransferase 2, mitochondrial isoform X2 [Agrilus planipennis]